MLSWRLMRWTRTNFRASASRSRSTTQVSCCWWVVGDGYQSLTTALSPSSDPASDLYQTSSWWLGRRHATACARARARTATSAPCPSTPSSGGWAADPWRALIRLQRSSSPSSLQSILLVPCGRQLLQDAEQAARAQQQRRKVSLVSVSDRRATSHSPSLPPPPPPRVSDLLADSELPHQLQQAHKDGIIVERRHGAPEEGHGAQEHWHERRQHQEKGGADKGRHAGRVCWGDRERGGGHFPSCSLTHSDVQDGRDECQRTGLEAVLRNAAGCVPGGV